MPWLNRFAILVLLFGVWCAGFDSGHQTATAHHKTTATPCHAPIDR